MLFEFLFGLEQVVHMVGAEHQHAVIAGDTHFVKFTLERKQVRKGHFLAGAVARAGGLDYGHIGGLLVGRD